MTAQSSTAQPASPPRLGEEPPIRRAKDRAYQLAADAAIDRELVTLRSTMLVAATGTGKTRMFCERVLRCKTSGGRSLIIAHRDELIRQPRRRLEEIGIYADVEKGRERASLNARVVIASVQSLRGARLTRFARDHFDLIIVDECHHATAAGYRAILDHFATAKVLGVTATPVRADGEALGVDGGGVFESVAHRYEIRQAIREQYLVPIVARRVVLDGIDLSAVRTRAGDLAQDQLAAVMETERAITGVVAPLLELARDRPTVVFGVDVAHAERLAASLNDRRAGCARAISGETDDHDRERLLAEYERGEFQFLCNCALLTEGWDAPHTSCVAIARPTKSWALFVQMVGRGTRLLGATYEESIRNGKHDLLLLNFTGKAGAHRLVGPADCLSGSEQGLDALPDDVRAEIDRMLGTQQLALDAVIASADAEVSKRRAEITAGALVRFHAEEIDPFVGDADHQAALHGRTVWGTKQPSEAQLKALDRAGVTLKRLPPSFTMADASRLLGRLTARRARGLCSLAQAKRIAQGTGIDTRRLTFERAKELCTLLRHGSWRPQALFGTPEYQAARAARAARAGLPETAPGVASGVASGVVSAPPPADRHLDHEALP